MYPWGTALGQVGEWVEYQERAYGAGLSSSFNYIPITGGSDDTLYIDNTDMEAVTIKAEEPPDEFTQLSNHKFYELLDRFNKLT